MEYSEYFEFKHLENNKVFVGGFLVDTKVMDELIEWQQRVFMQCFYKKDIEWPCKIMLGAWPCKITFEPRKNKKFKVSMELYFDLERSKERCSL